MLLMPWLVALTALACSPAREGEEAGFARAREEMVATQIAARGVRDPKTLAAMRKVPRHLFVPPAAVGQAYEDHPLPIGHGQTISQPYIVAFMTEALGLAGRRDASSRWAPGSGYQAAVLAEIAARVYTIEIVAPLAEESAALLKRLGYANVEVRAGDGYLGWPEAAPFDAIMVTAAAPAHPGAAQAAAQGRRAPRPARRRRVAGAGGRHPPRGPLRGEAGAARALRADDRQGPAVGESLAGGSVARRGGCAHGGVDRPLRPRGRPSSCSPCRSWRSSRWRARTRRCASSSRTAEPAGAWAAGRAEAPATRRRPATAAPRGRREPSIAARPPHLRRRRPAPLPPRPHRAPPRPRRRRRSRRAAAPGPSSPRPRRRPPTSPRTSGRRSSSARAASRSSSSWLLRALRVGERLGRPHGPRAERRRIQPGPDRGAGLRIIGREYRPLGQGLAAAGFAGLYITAFAAHAVYGLAAARVRRRLHDRGHRLRRPRGRAARHAPARRRSRGSAATWRPCSSRPARTAR